MVYPPLYVVFKNDIASPLRLPGLEPGELPITPYTGQFMAKGVSVFRRQMPILPAYSFTIEKCQGQTIIRVIIDVTSPTGRGGGNAISLESLYVAFSRARGRDGIRLLRPLDDKAIRLLTQRTSGALRAEDARSASQAADTKAAFEMGKLRDPRRHIKHYPYAL